MKRKENSYLWNMNDIIIKRKNNKFRMKNEFEKRKESKRKILIKFQ